MSAGGGELRRGRDFRSDALLSRASQGLYAGSRLRGSKVPWRELPFTSTPAALAEMKNAILDMTELDEVRLLRFDELSTIVR